MKFHCYYYCCLSLRHLDMTNAGVQSYHLFAETGAAFHYVKNMLKVDPRRGCCSYLKAVIINILYNKNVSNGNVKEAVIGENNLTSAFTVSLVF